MPRGRKKKTNDNSSEDPNKRRRLMKHEIERQICKKKLDILESQELRIGDDRFSYEEKRRLLEAYHEKGFRVFHDTHLLAEYFPNRRESDLKGLLDRLTSSLIPDEDAQQKSPGNPIDDWFKLCQQLIGAFARDKKVNLDDIYPESLSAESEATESHSDLNYPALMKYFALLMKGQFPESMAPRDAQLSIKLFNHLNSIIDSIDIDKATRKLKDGSWIEEASRDKARRHELALAGLDDLDRKLKKCPSIRDFETNRNIEALCLELPKLRRIGNILNPLSINESLVKEVMAHYEKKD